LESESLK